MPTTTAPRTGEVLIRLREERGSEPLEAKAAAATADRPGGESERAAAAAAADSPCPCPFGGELDSGVAIPNGLPPAGWIRRPPLPPLRANDVPTRFGWGVATRSKEGGAGIEASPASGEKARAEEDDAALAGVRKLASASAADADAYGGTGETNASCGGGRGAGDGGCAAPSDDRPGVEANEAPTVPVVVAAAAALDGLLFDFGVCSLGATRVRTGVVAGEATPPPPLVPPPLGLAWSGGGDGDGDGDSEMVRPAVGERRTPSMAVCLSAATGHQRQRAGSHCEPDRPEAKSEGTHRQCR